MSSCCSGEASDSSSASSSTLDPDIKQAELDWLDAQSGISDTAQGYVDTGYTRYGGQKVAGLDPLQQQAIDSYQTGVYQPYLDSATKVAETAATYQPTLASAALVTPGSLSTTDLSPYMDPYTKDVTEATLSDFDRASKLVGTNAQQAATTQGAFGGSGQGVFQANNQDNLNQTLASTLASLNEGNFTNAQTQATNDLNRDLTGQLGNQTSLNTTSQFNSGIGLDAARMNLSAADTLASLGMQAQQGQTTDASNLMSMGGTSRDVTQQGLDWDYENNFYNKNYEYPTWAISMLNSGQGNMPTAQTLTTSDSDSTSGGASCG